MGTQQMQYSFARLTRIFCWLGLAGLAVAVPQLQAADDEDFDAYKFKITGFWFYSQPSGTLSSANTNSAIDFEKDIGLNSYSTFSGKLDWKFTRKNHVYFVVSPFRGSHDTVLTRTIEYQGQTFVAGLGTHSDIQSNLYAPGYQYDIMRRKRGHLGIAAQLDLFDTSASLTAAAQITGNGVQQAARSASGSVFAPIPVVGPEFRLYLTNSPRLYVQGNVFGMYLFGYGNLISSAGSLGVRVAKHMNVNAGYQLGSRLVINSDQSTNRIGLRLTQVGSVVGVEFPF